MAANPSFYPSSLARRRGRELILAGLGAVVVLAGLQATGLLTRMEWSCGDGIRRLALGAHAQNPEPRPPPLG